jgi:integrase/recombinase XerD
VINEFTKMKQTQNEIALADRKPKNLTIHSGIVLLKQTIKYWEKDYINETINKISNHKDKMLLFTLWRTGLRITEIINIKKQDIDFKNYTMQVRYLKSRKYLNRIVPMHPQLKDMLQLYSAGMNLEQKLFPITRQRADQIVKHYFGKDGYCHRFRHSFAINWLRSGGNIVDLHALLGHAKIQTTMEYLKIVPTDLGKELLKIDFG